MSLLEQINAEHKARLSRLNALPPKPVPIVRIKIKPVEHDAGWDHMWFWDLVTGHSKEPRQVRIREIQQAVCKHYDISILDVLSGRRSRAISFPRQVAMYLCRHMTAHSFAEIGRRFGGRDHTTVIHASQKIEGFYGFDMRVTCDVNVIKKALA